MAKMSDHVEELLDRYRTGELDEPDRQRVERHLGACAACRGELEALTAFALTVERGYAAERAARAAEREPDWARLRASIVERTAARHAGAGRLRLGRYVPQAALAVLALVAVGVLWEQGVRGPDEAERVLRSERRTASRGDQASEGPGGPAVTAGADRLERERDDRFAAPAELPEGQEPVGNVGVEPPDEERVGHDVALDEFRDADPAGRRAGQAEAEPSADQPDRLAKAAEAAAPGEGAAAQAREEDAEANVAPPPELERFQTAARTALSEADTLRAARALAQWRDSLAPRQDLPPALERAARALADSLAAFLASRP